MQRARVKIDVEAAEPGWTPAREELWRRIAGHDFEPDTPLNFTQRLARDHGWSVEQARAAIEGYRRFCFLAMVSPTPVTPTPRPSRASRSSMVVTPYDRPTSRR